MIHRASLSRFGKSPRLRELRNPPVLVRIQDIDLIVVSGIRADTQDAAELDPAIVNRRNQIMLPFAEIRAA